MLEYRIWNTQKKPTGRLIPHLLQRSKRNALNAVKAMKDEDIDTDDIPEADFSDASLYYKLGLAKEDGHERRMARTEKNR